MFFPGGGPWNHFYFLLSCLPFTLHTGEHQGQTYCWINYYSTLLWTRMLAKGSGSHENQMELLVSSSNKIAVLMTINKTGRQEGRVLTHIRLTKRPMARLCQNHSFAQGPCSLTQQIILPLLSTCLFNLGLASSLVLIPDAKSQCFQGIYVIFILPFYLFPFEYPRFPWHV